MPLPGHTQSNTNGQKSKKKLNATMAHMMGIKSIIRLHNLKLKCNLLPQKNPPKLKSYQNMSILDIKHLLMDGSREETANAIP